MRVLLPKRRRSELRGGLGSSAIRKIGKQNCEIIIERCTRDSYLSFDYIIKKGKKGPSNICLASGAAGGYFPLLFSIHRGFLLVFIDFNW